MKTIPLGFAALIAMGATSAFAACSDTALTAAQLHTLLDGNTACYPAGGGPNWTNQEAHSGGTITDYKKGPSDPIDKSTQVGSYSIGGTDVGSVTYSYQSGGSYTYTVVGPDPASTGLPHTYEFCSGGSISVSIESGAGHGC
jgi:hypothetical protein